MYYWTSRDPITVSAWWPFDNADITQMPAVKLSLIHIWFDDKRQFAYLLLPCGGQRIVPVFLDGHLFRIGEEPSPTICLLRAATHLRCGTRLKESR